MQRRRLVKLVIGILAATTAALLSVQIALADTLVPSPAHGQPTDPATFTFAMPLPPTGGCSPNTLISFWWDSLNYGIGNVPLTNDPNNKQQCIAVLNNFVPAKSSPPVNTSVGAHIVQAGQKTPTARAQYTIDTPPPPPSPTPTPTPTPTPSPTPTSTPISTPGTTPPTTTTPPTQPPTSAPTPIQRPTPSSGPSPRCYVEGISPLCPSPSTPTCASPGTAMLPGTPSGGGVPPLMLALMVVPLGAMLLIAPGLKATGLTRTSVLLLLVVTASCAWPPPKSVATSPNAVIGFEVTPDCRGYWIGASDGGIVPFGGATGYGSAGAMHLNKPNVDLESTPDGGGYWLVASDGGVFPFGNATGYGSSGGIKLNKPIVAVENTTDGGGDWRGGCAWGGS